eukprot:Partr_v1_DN26759_c0_g1_i5_m8590 putative Tumor susceptibility gene 101
MQKSKRCSDILRKCDVVPHSRKYRNLNLMDQRKQTLKQLTVAYPHSSKVKKDVESVFANHPGLFPKQETINSETGFSQKMLCLAGTIAVSYKSQSYNIPIVLWIPFQYPHQYPMLFVRPTENMVVKTSRYVDQTGKVYHPYISNWMSTSDDRRNLVELLRQMQMVFGEEPPVYSRPAAMPPSTSGVVSMPSPPQVPVQRSNTNPTTPSLYQSSSLQSSSTTSATSRPHSFSSTASPLYNSAPLQMPTTQFNTMRISQPVMSVTLSAEEQALAERRMTLESRTKALLGFRRPALSEQIDKALDVNQSLLQADTAIKEDLIRMRRDKEVLVKAVEDLSARIRDVKEKLEKLQSMPQPDAMDVFISTSPLHNQLLDNLAEDQAIEDCLYALGLAFKREQIDLSTYMKHIRSYSFDQFMKRALALKIHRTLQQHHQK